MNFFQSQQRARQKTAMLFLYLLLAYIFIVGVFNLAASTAFWLFMFYDVEAGSRPAFRFWAPDLFPWVSSVVLFLVVAATIYNLIRLWRGGGKAVVAMLNGRAVAGDTVDPDERKLLNVVAEMALASGAPVPEVFIIPEEEGINAFAAGLSPDQALVVVTRGCIVALSRDELQGVIAHEFSHILNGDMRLNLRLMATVNGLMFFTILGLGIMENSDNLGVLAAGAVVAAIGSIGVFCAAVIKSAVSRQREFLADASAVQFTRNPGGIAGALRKIMEAGSRINNFRAGEASHLYFASGVRQAFLRLLATHPPLGERLRQIDPTMTGLPEDAEVPEAAPASFLPGEMLSAALSSPGTVRGGTRISAGKLVGSIGAPQSEHLRYAAVLRAEIPPALADAVALPASASALVYALLISADEAVAAQQIQLLQEKGGAEAIALTRSLLVTKQMMKPEQRLPLLDLAMPALKNLAPAQYRQFREGVVALALADGAWSLFEFMLITIVKRRLDPSFIKEKSAALRRPAAAVAATQSRVLISLLAWEGAADAAAAERAYRSGMEVFGPVTSALLPRSAGGMEVLEEACAVLAATAPAFQARLIKACLLAISADMRITAGEAELLRAVADSLGCPMPPILPGLLKDEAGEAPE
ncbi:MAG: M48 family metalloprotease [Desulfobulbaceae bacterium]|nr:M48 family metalloprotease [Desulfobulbaceae bacterium]